MSSMVQVSGFVSKETKKELKQYCFDNDVNQKTVIKMAIEEFLKRRTQTK